jgi:hypothetical protein
MMHCDDRIDQIAPQCSKPRKSAILVCTYQPTVSDYIGNKYRRDFPCLVHAIPIAQKSAPPDNASKLHLLRTDVCFGSQQTYAVQNGMSALPLKADSDRDPIAGAKGIAVQSRRFRLFSAQVLPN